MTTTIGKSQCIKCGKEKRAVKCEGCQRLFCFDHLPDHRQELSQQLDEIEINRNLYQQIFHDQRNNPVKNSLIKQINEWEENSIKIIQQTARECRQILFHCTTAHIKQTEMNLTEITDQIREIRKENDFNEIDLNQCKQKLIELKKELDQPSVIIIQQDSTTLINKISVVVSSRHSSQINLNTKWKQNGITIAGGNDRGNQLNQLYLPKGIYVDDDSQCIYIADWCNHRIVKWKYGANIGEVVVGGNKRGDRIDQLNFPSDVIVDKNNDWLIICDKRNRRVVRWSHPNDKNQQIIISNIDCFGITMDQNGDLYVSDSEKNEVRQWKIDDKDGILVAGGNGKGNHLNQLSEPTYIFVDQDYSVYVSDRANHRVMKWIKGAKEGIIVAGGQGKGNFLTQLSCPEGIIVDHWGQIYVADCYNNRIMRWSPRSKEGCIIVGGNGGEQSNHRFII